MPIYLPAPGRDDRRRAVRSRHRHGGRARQASVLRRSRGRRALSAVSRSAARGPPARAGATSRTCSRRAPTARQFSAAQVYATIRFTLTVWEHYLGRPVRWYFRRRFPHLEVIPRTRSGTAYSRPGYIECGYERGRTRSAPLPARRELRRGRARDRPPDPAQRDRSPRSRRGPGAARPRGSVRRSGGDRRAPARAAGGGPPPGPHAGQSLLGQPAVPDRRDEPDHRGPPGQQRQEHGHARVGPRPAGVPI